jgi:hypothetical protein
MFFASTVDFPHSCLPFPIFLWLEPIFVFICVFNPYERYNQICSEQKCLGILLDDKVMDTEVSTAGQRKRTAQFHTKCGVRKRPHEGYYDTKACKCHVFFLHSQKKYVGTIFDFWIMMVRTICGCLICQEPAKIHKIKANVLPTKCHFQAQ